VNIVTVASLTDTCLSTDMSFSFPHGKNIIRYVPLIILFQVKSLSLGFGEPQNLLEFQLTSTFPIV